MEPGQKPRLRKIGLVAILVLLCLIAFIPGLKAPFFYDDLNTILMNPAIQSPGDYGRYFHQLESFSADQARMFRPLVLISLAMNWKWFQDRTLGWHLTNLLGHLLCVILVYFLLQALSGSRQMAFLAAALFAVHPSRVEPVLYLSARSEIFASLFYLLSFLLFLKSQTARKKSAELILGIFSLLGFWLGLFSKDLAITLPAALTLERIFFRQLNRKSIIWLAIFWGNALIYFWVRRALNLYTFLPPARPRPVLENLLLQSRVMVYYLRWLIFPIHNSVEAKFSPVSPAGIILSMLLLAAVVAAGIYLARTKPLIGFLVFFFFIVLSPSSSVVSLVVEGNLVRGYLAGLFIFVVLAELILFAPSAGLRARLKIVLAVIYFVCLLGLSWNWSAAWQSPSRLWSETVKNFPDHSRARNNLGILLERKGNFRQAEREYYQAARTDPGNPSALVNYGRMLFGKEEFDRAELYFRKALELEPWSCTTRINYSQLLISTGRMEEAKQLLDQVNSCPGYQDELDRQKERIRGLLGQ